MEIIPVMSTIHYHIQEEVAETHAAIIRWTFECLSNVRKIPSNETGEASKGEANTIGPSRYISC